MKISHESPIDLLEDSLIYNDYEYALLHLMHIPEYKEFYKRAVNNGRAVYLDNSAYEYQFIEGGFDINYYIDVINEIKPTHIILPDTIADTESTIENAKSFPFERISYNAKYIGVTQGLTNDELNKCFDFMNNFDKVDVISLVFHSPAYQKNNGNIDYNNTRGRFNFFNNIEKRLKKPIHLLGCSLPKEFKLYNSEKIISMDSAVPVQWGILGKKFSFDIDVKPKCVLDESVIKSNTPNKDLILENIKIFRDSLASF